MRQEDLLVVRDLTQVTDRSVTTPYTDARCLVPSTVGPSNRTHLASMYSFGRSMMTAPPKSGRVVRLAAGRDMLGV
jgi:hypothetical protein